MSDSNEVALTLAGLQNFIPATMSLYDGRLVKTETELFFIAERFSGWEIMERCDLKDIQKVEVSESFMGKVVEVHTSGSHWSLKDVSEGTDVEQWILGKPTQNKVLDTEPEAVQSDLSVTRDDELSETNPPISNVTPQEIEQEEIHQRNPVTPSVYPVSTNPQVNELRQILIDQPELQAKVHQAIGKHVDPLDEEVLSLFMRRHIQSYLQVRIASGEVISPFETLKVVQTQMKANPGGELAVKLIQGFAGVLIVMFALPIVVGILGALVTIISIIF